MTFTPIPNGVRIVHLGTYGGRQVVNTLGCENGIGAVGTDLGVLAKTHGDAWRANIVPKLAAPYQHVDTLAYSLEDQSLAPGDAGYASPVAGGVGGQGLPAQVAMIVSLRTAKRGRTMQGRMYLTGIWATATSDGLTFPPTSTSIIQTAMGAYKNAVDPGVNGNNGRMAICSKGSPLKNIPPHVEAVTGIVVRSYMGTQRRRVN